MHPYSSITNADQRFSPGIADNGGLALVSFWYGGRPGRDVRRNILSRRDNPAAPPGGTAAGTPTPVPGTSDQSYERKPGGDTSCYDTNNNVNDFNLISPANPQNQANGNVMCAGVVLTSPTRTPTITHHFHTYAHAYVPTAIPAAVVA